MGNITVSTKYKLIRLKLDTDEITKLIVEFLINYFSLQVNFITTFSVNVCSLLRFF